MSEGRRDRGLTKINSSIGVREGAAEREGHMQGAGRSEMHVKAAREVRDAGRCRTVQSERASAKRASESARIWRARGGVPGLRATSCSQSKFDSGFNMRYLLFFLMRL